MAVFQIFTLINLNDMATSKRPPEDDSKLPTFKLVVIGEGGVGKSSLTIQFFQVRCWLQHSALHPLFLVSTYNKTHAYENGTFMKFRTMFSNRHETHCRSNSSITTTRRLRTSTLYMLKSMASGLLWTVSFSSYFLLSLWTDTVQSILYYFLPGGLQTLRFPFLSLMSFSSS